MACVPVRYLLLFVTLGRSGLGFGLDLGEYRFDAELVDAAQPGGGYAQAHPAALALHPEAAVARVRLVRSDRLFVGVREEVDPPPVFSGDPSATGRASTPGVL